MKYFPFLLIFAASVAKAQFHQPVFSTLTGQELIESVKSSYKANVLLQETQARDTLFSVVYGQNDSLACVYTGYAIWLDPTQDPTQAAFDKDLNTEHTFPKSLGATGQAEGDMHHLFATRSDVNNARANSPFSEIPDNETTEWYYLDNKLTSIPTSNIDLYSERKGELFEPREDHKGNVARAMFYFYTMYKEQADMANATFFETQRETLCAWHLQDPVDQQEWDRTWLIANYQSGKPNPFVLDCTLPERSYCAEFGQVCTPTTSSVKTETQVLVVEQVSPNPLSQSTLFTYSLTRPGQVELTILNLAGKMVEKVNAGKQEAGPHQLLWEAKPHFGTGLFFYKLVFSFDNQQVIAPGKLMIID